MELNVIWFILIAVLFTGFFFLEGFDYGVGTLLPFISPNDDERTQVLRTIAPVWDGNEVWMITAGGALFAAFPHVYATMFSTFYLALFLMLVALILRGVAFELRGRHPSICWRRFWDGAICFGSAVPAFLWGVAITDLIQGLPINEKMIYTGGFLDLLTPYSIVGGLTFLLVFLFHGAAFLTQRLTNIGLIQKAQQWAQRAGAFAIIAFVFCLLMTLIKTDLFQSCIGGTALLAAGVFFILGYRQMFRAHYQSSFILSSLTIVATTLAFFAGLFPRLMVSSLNPAWSLTIHNAASTPYTLGIMTMAAAVLVPIVLIYQGWTYWIFRQRISPKDCEETH
ncbi:cytochrome d ubiquinol oxidase subunit II [Selenomonas sp.]|uniref:cytochrome d ubiquinol oxidase subunit II n=1 Tax=Selenomonas sp. TaxID=2053611 RepID=UPI0025D2CC3B|nr:cytochrome d ubiquinol oxidase subunit II [Selenomonas sp.]MBQ1867587.1 cytochrome d ubiquinol oxidase subunit II [Selenomonas sp.]